jgi:hypothetical protein
MRAAKPKCLKSMGPPPTPEDPLLRKIILLSAARPKWTKIDTYDIKIIIIFITFIIICKKETKWDLPKESLELEILRVLWRRARERSRWRVCRGAAWQWYGAVLVKRRLALRRWGHYSTDHDAKPAGRQPDAAGYLATITRLSGRVARVAPSWELWWTYVRHVGVSFTFWWITHLIQ